MAETYVTAGTFVDRADHIVVGGEPPMSADRCQKINDALVALSIKSGIISVANGANSGTLFTLSTVVVGIYTVEIINTNNLSGNFLHADILVNGSGTVAVVIVKEGGATGTITLVNTGGAISFNNTGVTGNHYWALSRLY